MTSSNDALSREEVERIRAVFRCFSEDDEQKVRLDKLCNMALASLSTSAPKAYAEKNPLGGPATMFEKMAERIRAGEDYYAVLEDYSLAHVPNGGSDKVVIGRTLFNMVCNALGDGTERNVALREALLVAAPNGKEEKR